MGYIDTPLMGLTLKIFYVFKTLINLFYKFLLPYGKITTKHRLLINYDNPHINLIK